MKRILLSLPVAVALLNAPVYCPAAEQTLQQRAPVLARPLKPLEVTRYQCVDELSRAHVMVDPAYLQDELNDPLAEAVTSQLWYRLHLKFSQVDNHDKNYVICRYSAHRGKIDDFRYRRFCRDARPDPTAGQHVYICVK